MYRTIVRCCCCFFPRIRFLRYFESPCSPLRCHCNGLVRIICDDNDNNDVVWKTKVNPMNGRKINVVFMMRQNERSSTIVWALIVNIYGNCTDLLWWSSWTKFNGLVFFFCIPFVHRADWTYMGSWPQCTLHKHNQLQINPIWANAIQLYRNCQPSSFHLNFEIEAQSHQRRRT